MTTVQRVKLTAQTIESFAGMFLSPMYDNPAPVAKFHRLAWQLYCNGNPRCAVAAPRAHAKSTALTHDYGIGAALFREEDYIVIASNTEKLAMGHLGDIARVFRDNEEVNLMFGIDKIETDNKSDIVVLFRDGHRCRFYAIGSGQSMRGIKWEGKRPGLIICDDLEDDDQVSNFDSRQSFKYWFIRELSQTIRKGGKIRVHGTILHEDSLLANLMKSKSWNSLLFKAHDGYDDFDNLLWPEQYNEEWYREKRQSFIDIGDASGYSQEYLNDPRDNAEAYLKKEDFLPMQDIDYTKPKMVAVGCDFAISKSQKSDRTSFTVGGKCVNNLVHVISQSLGRWDSLEIINNLFEVNQRWKPDVFFVENDSIWKSISPMIRKEMQVRGVWINFHPIWPTGDKAVRGRPLQKQMRGGGMRFDKKASWYEPYEDELLRFTGNSDAVRDDQFDSTAILIKGFEIMANLMLDDFKTDDELEFENQNPHKRLGISSVTGY